jgi:restriction endonuclease S subunit
MDLAVVLPPLEIQKTIAEKCLELSESIQRLRKQATSDMEQAQKQIEQMIIKN